MSRSTHRLYSEDITVGNEGGMAGAAIGQVETFDTGRESIAAYLERVELFLAANAVPAEW